MTIDNPEVRTLANISQSLEREYREGNQEWEGSPFAWIKTRPSSRQVGAIGEKLVAAWLTARGFRVARSGDTEADRIVEGKRVEIKFSTLWAKGVYKFQQIRDQDYDLVICLGVSPFDAHCWVIPKDDIIRFWDEGKIKDQHGGKHENGKEKREKKRADTGWFSVQVESPPDWLEPYGGPLDKAISVLAEITGFEMEKAE